MGIGRDVCGLCDCLEPCEGWLTLSTTAANLFAAKSELIALALRVIAFRRVHVPVQIYMSHVPMSTPAGRSRWVTLSLTHTHSRTFQFHHPYSSTSHMDIHPGSSTRYHKESCESRFLRAAFDPAHVPWQDERAACRLGADVTCRPRECVFTGRRSGTGSRCTRGSSAGASWRRGRRARWRGRRRACPPGG